MKIKLHDEIEHMKALIEVYRTPRAIKRIFLGDGDKGQALDCAVSTLARLERAMVLKKRAGANQKKLWGDVKKARQERRTEAAA